MGYKAAKAKVLAALNSGAFDHEARDDINVKNLLSTGDISAADVAKLIAKSSGYEHTESPHHSQKLVTVHCIITQKWYIKFYFLDPDTTFISVHQ
ncbi:hypothetical protein [Duganella sacchari]|uniref:hypothetical protein n=1 Tax=Duganella sacchari TaxID=551987 RepID=UPI000933321D|nr:hypothetical protein [Duganella sacchari]